jgi:TonB family protein
MKLVLAGVLLVGLSIACHAGNGLCVSHVDVPGYPVVGWQARLQGSVALNVDIAADGEVVSVSASGANTLLQKAAADNIRTWRFCSSPAKQNVTITYVYKLEGEETDRMPREKVVVDLPEQIIITSRPPMPQG